jgi:hypothetical protein
MEAETWSSGGVRGGAPNLMAGIFLAMAFHTMSTISSGKTACMLVTENGGPLAAISPTSVSASGCRCCAAG